MAGKKAKRGLNISSGAVNRLDRRLKENKVIFCTSYRDLVERAYSSALDRIIDRIGVCAMLGISANLTQEEEQIIKVHSKKIKESK